MAICPNCGKEFNNIDKSGLRYGANYCSIKCERSIKQIISGYIHIWNDEREKYYPEHRIIFEKYLGRKLLKNEIIHHRNGKKDDNRLENLQLLISSNHCPGIETRHSEDICKLLYRIKKLEKKLAINRRHK